MIGLYFKEKILWHGTPDRYNYLVTRYEVVYYNGKVPERVKDDSITDEGLELVRIFLRRLRNGNFYFELSKFGYGCYHGYLGLNSLDYSLPFLTTCGHRVIRYFEAYWFKHIIEHAVKHYIGQGEAIAGAILEKYPYRIIKHSNGVEVDIDTSDSYLPIAWEKVKSLMRGKKWINSITWANREIIEVNHRPVIKDEA